MSLFVGELMAGVEWLLCRGRGITHAWMTRRAWGGCIPSQGAIAKRILRRAVRLPNNLPRGGLQKLIPRSRTTSSL
jgi:hypothetical protein